MASSGSAEATAKLEVAKLEERRQKIHNLITQEKQSHDRKMAGLSANLADVNAKIAGYQQGLGQQGASNANGGLQEDLLRSPRTHGNAVHSTGNIISGGLDSSIVAPDAPPGFSGNVHAQGSLFLTADLGLYSSATIAQRQALPQQQHQLQQLTSTAQPLHTTLPPCTAPLSPKPIPASVLRMLLPLDKSIWLDTSAASDTPHSDWHPSCSSNPSVQFVQSAPGNPTNESRTQKQNPHSQTGPGPHPHPLFPIPPLHPGDPQQVLPCSRKRPISAFDYPPAFSTFLSDFSCTNPSSMSGSVFSTKLSGRSHFPDPPSTVPQPDFTTPHPFSDLPPMSTCPFSFGDFPVVSDVHLYSAKPKCADMQGHSGNMSANRQHQSSPATSKSASVFDRLQQTPPQQQQATSSTPPRPTSQTPTHPNLPQPPQGTHDLPPGFASPEGLPAGAGDFPPGFTSPRSSTAAHSAQRSRMRSDQMAAPAQPEQSSAHSAQAAPSQRGQGGSPGGLPGGPPGFGGLPAYLAQRLSPSPAQKPSKLPDQAGPHQSRPTSNSPEQGNNHRAGQNSRQHLPAAAYDGLSDDSSDEEPPGFARATTTTGQQGQAPTAGSSALANPKNSTQPPGQKLPGPNPPGYGSSNGAPTDNNGFNQESHSGGQDEFPGLAFGIKDMDQHQKFSSAGSSQDFPSLGSAAGGEGGPKPAGVWGRGAGHLAGSLRQQQQQQQQQVSSVASSLAAAVQSPQPPTVHIERVELGANLRVAGDNASDSIRRKRAKRNEFEQWQRVKGMGLINLVEGLELYENVLSPEEQANMIHIIEDWVVQGKQGKLRGRTFSAPRKWARGKGRITCQFGCCYNYAVDSEGRKPGIVAEEVVEKMPPVLVSLCKRLIRWGILPKHKEPDTAIINVYDVDDCIPPHIDHHDFDRPFCTISLLTQQNIMFGSRIISRGPGDFVADYEMPLPTGSCLVLKGNGADVAQHCVPPVTARRMSITLRRMQDVHARRVVAMAERISLGLPVDTDNPPSGPQRLTADDAYHMDERKEAASGYGARRRNG